MKKIMILAFFLTANSVVFAQEQAQPCNDCNDSEQEAIWVDPNFEDNYEDSDVNAQTPEPQVSWPGRNRDPFYDQVKGS